MITLQNVGKHEFIGLSCNVESAANNSDVGICGKIIDETMKTVTFDVHGNRKKVQKHGTKFVFKLPGGSRVRIDGNKIIARPEDRIKKKFKKW